MRSPRRCGGRAVAGDVSGLPDTNRAKPRRSMPWAGTRASWVNTDLPWPTVNSRWPPSPSLGDRYGQALTWDSVGYIQHQLGDLDAATVSYQRSLDLWHDLADRLCMADILVRLGRLRSTPPGVPPRRGRRGRRRWPSSRSSTTPTPMPSGAGSPNPNRRSDEHRRRWSGRGPRPSCARTRTTAPTGSRNRCKRSGCWSPAPTPRPNPHASLPSSGRRNGQRSNHLRRGLIRRIAAVYRRPLGRLPREIMWPYIWRVAPLSITRLRWWHVDDLLPLGGRPVRPRAVDRGHVLERARQRTAVRGRHPGQPDRRLRRPCPGPAGRGMDQQHRGRAGPTSARASASPCSTIS